MRRRALLTWAWLRTNSALTIEAVNEIKTTIHDLVSQTQPDLEVHVEEITESLNSLAFETSALSGLQYRRPDEHNSLQKLERTESSIEEDRLALEAEKKAMEQSQQVCETAFQQLEGASSQLHSQVNVTFSGANNSGLQLGQNMGVVSNLRWGMSAIEAKDVLLPGHRRL